MRLVPLSRTIRWLAIALACAATVTVATTAAAQAPPPLRFLAVGDTFHPVDRGKKGASAGDVNISTGRLYAGTTTSSEQRAGRLEIVCTAIDARARHFLCDVVARTRDGEIHASGHIDRERSHLAVLGGTGTYTGASGELTVQMRPRGRLSLTYDLAQ